MSINRRPIFAVLLALVLSAAGARACTIPVFRYALERWTASPYEVVLFRDGQPGQADRERAEQQVKSSANVEVRTVDASARMGDADRALWQAQKSATLPWAVIRFPDAVDGAAPLWAGADVGAALAEQLDSPARREIARRLTAGDSCVWVMLASVDKDHDDRVAGTLARELGRLEGSLKLPEIAPDGPQLRSALPLLVKFSVLRVACDDPREAALVRMLRLVDPELAQSEDALVIPVIGRGRAVSAIPGKRVNADRLGAFAEFVCGKCSCEVKELNPGIDLLMAGNWDAIFDDALGGLAGAATAATPATPSARGRPVAIPSAGGAFDGGSDGAAATPVVAGAADGGHVYGYTEATPAAASARRRWIVVGIVGAVALAIVSGGAVLRARRS